MRYLAAAAWVVLGGIRLLVAAAAGIVCGGITLFVALTLDALIGDQKFVEGDIGVPGHVFTVGAFVSVLVAGYTFYRVVAWPRWKL